MTSNGIAAAAAVVFTLGFAASAQAACGQADCQSQGPLRLQRFMEHQSSAKHAKPRAHKAAARRAQRTAKPAEPPKPARAAASDQRSASAKSATAKPKEVPTITINARGLSVVPADSKRVGFSASTEPWDGISAFAATGEPTTQAAQPGPQIVPADQYNAIDHTADQRRGQSAATPVSLVTPAEAAKAGSSQMPPRAAPNAIERLYDRAIDGVLTAALALRSLFH